MGESSLKVTNEVSRQVSSSGSDCTREQALQILEAFLLRSLSTADVSPLRHYYESRGSFSKPNQNEVLEKREDEKTSEGNDDETFFMDGVENELTVMSNGFTKVKVARTHRGAQRPKSYFEALKHDIMKNAEEKHSENKDTHVRSRSLDSKLPHRVNVNETGKNKSSSSIDIMEQLVKRSIKQRKSVPLDVKMATSMKKSKSHGFNIETPSIGHKGEQPRGGLASHAHFAASSETPQAENGVNVSSSSSSLSCQEDSQKSKHKKGVISRIKHSFRQKSHSGDAETRSEMTNSAFSKPRSRKSKFSFLRKKSKSKTARINQEGKDSNFKPLEENATCFINVLEAGENEEKPQTTFSESVEEVVFDRVPAVVQWGSDLPSVQTAGRRRHKSADTALDSNESVTTPKGLVDVINRVHSSQGLDCILQEGDGVNPSIVMERRVSSGSLRSMGGANERQVVIPTEPIPIPRPQTLKVSPVREIFEEGDMLNEKTHSEQKLYAEKISDKLNEFILKEQTHGDMSPRSSRDMEMLQLKYTEVMKQLKELQQLEPVYREAGRTDGPSSLEKEIAAWFVEKCATDDLTKVISPNVVLDLLGNLNYSQFQHAAQRTTDRADGEEYKLPLLFGLTRFGITLVGYGTNAAQRLKDYCTQYVQDKLGWALVTEASTPNSPSTPVDTGKDIEID